VSDDLEVVSQRYDLTLDMHVENPTNEPDPHFLLKYFEHLFVRAGLQQLAMHLEAPDRFGAAMRWTEFEGRVFWRIVGTRRGMLRLYVRPGS